MELNRHRSSRIVARVLPLAMIAFLLPALPTPGHAGPPDSGARVAATVQELNLENVRVASFGDTVEVRYENRVFRNPLEALGAVAAAAAPGLPPDSRLELVTLSRGIPILTIAATARDWTAFLDGSLSEAEFRARVEITDGSAVRGRATPPDTPALSPAWRKLDVALRPLAQIELGVPDDPFKFGLWVAPEVTTMPFHGALLTAQAVVQLRDDLDPFARPWRPGRTTLSYAGWLPASLLGTANAGYFPSNRYGVAWAVGRFLADGQLEAQLSGDYTGFLKFSRNGVVLYSGMKAWSAVAAVTHRLRGLDVATTLSGGRFLHGDTGGRVDVARRFHETEFGFFAVKTDGGSMAGLRFTVPLPVRHYGAPRRVRLVTIPDFPFEYRENTNPVGQQVSLYDDLDRIRQRTNPVFLWNNLDQLRTAGRGGSGGER